jgi:hypothetical protein
MFLKYCKSLHSSVCYYFISAYLSVKDHERCNFSDISGFSYGVHDSHGYHGQSRRSRQSRRRQITAEHGRHVHSCDLGSRLRRFGADLAPAASVATAISDSGRSLRGFNTFDIPRPPRFRSRGGFSIRDFRPSAFLLFLLKEFCALHDHKREKNKALIIIISMSLFQHQAEPCLCY